MKISVFGTGYVGLVTGACLADAGNHVVCVDIDPRKVDMLSRGELPIHEPGLHAVVKRNFEASRLRFTTDAKEGVKHGLFQFIEVRRRTRMGRRIFSTCWRWLVPSANT